MSARRVLTIGAVLIALTSCAPSVATIEEDQPGWNCLTMGNRVCGPDFVSVSQSIGDALDDLSATSRDWSACLISEGDTSYIVCPDGFTESS